MPCKKNSPGYFLDAFSIIVYTDPIEKTMKFQVSLPPGSAGHQGGSWCESSAVPQL